MSRSSRQSKKSYFHIAGGRRGGAILNENFSPRGSIHTLTHTQRRLFDAEPPSESKAKNIKEISGYHDAFENE